MNSVFEFLFARRPRFNYAAPSICEVNFSASSLPHIHLNPIEPLASPTGLEFGGGGHSRFRLTWNRYPGALCYNVYKAVDELDPFGAYTLIAECISDNFIDVDDFGPGCYRITSVTPEGESPFSDPECIANETLPPDVTTEEASDVASGSATLNGTINPNSFDSSFHFEWGTDTGYGNVTPDQPAGNGSVFIPLSASIGSLIGETTYHYRAVGTNDNGTSVGDDKQFTTPGGGGGGGTIEPLIGMQNVFDINESGVVVGVRSGGLAGYWDTSIHTITLGGSGGTASAINDNGQIVGQSEDAGFNLHAFWFDGSTRDEGTFTVWNTWMYAIAPDGFGVIQESAPGSTATYLYDSGSLTRTNIGTLGGLDTYVDGFDSGSGGKAYRRKVNSAHQVTGVSKDALTFRKAFRWSGGVMTSIHPTFPTAGDFSAGLYIDESGAVVGRYDFNDGVHIGYSRTFINLSGGGANSTDIGGAVDHNINPYSMSKSGQIICGVQDIANTNFTAFVWDSINGYIVIPKLNGGDDDFVSDVNSSRDVVGANSTTAWLYRGGNIYDLTPIAAAIDPNWTAIYTAELINDNKQIVGFGLYLGSYTCYRMTLPDGAETP